MKRYDEVEAVRGIDLDIADHEFVVLVGPSGCGKSTTLRMIAGLEEITDGDIAIGGDVVNDVPPKDRDIAMVFQNYALYPHMTVAENMSFGLRLKRYPKAEIKSARRRRPPACSTSPSCSTASRSSSPAASASASPWAAPSCATRRCSCSTSRCPTSTPSCACRCAPRSRSVHQKVRTTTVYVTHDQVEAMTLADRVVVMNTAGSSRSARRTSSITAGDHAFVAGFIGSPAMNFIPAGWRTSAASCMSASPTASPSRCRRPARLLPGDCRAPTGCCSASAPNITEAKPHAEPGVETFDAVLDVTEPMGMETLDLLHAWRGRRSAAGSTPMPARRTAAPLRLAVDLNNMHLLNEATGVVL